MRRLTEAWFEFNGVRSDQMGLRVTELPIRYSPMRRGQEMELAGMDGFIWIPEDAFMATDLTVKCETTADCDMDAVRAWLFAPNTECPLRFSDDQGHSYKAIITESMSDEFRFLRFDRKVLSIPFKAQPYRYAWPAEPDILLTDAGNVQNTGTAKSQPKLTITATGDYSLTVNGVQVDVTGGSVVIDTELMECWDDDGLANSRVAMDDIRALVLQPGNNAVEWTGAVTSVRVERRVRDY